MSVFMQEMQTAQTPAEPAESVPTETPEPTPPEETPAAEVPAAETPPSNPVMDKEIQAFQQNNRALERLLAKIEAQGGEPSPKQIQQVQAVKSRLDTLKEKLSVDNFDGEKFFEQGGGVLRELVDELAETKKELAELKGVTTKTAEEMAAERTNREQSRQAAEYWQAEEARSPGSQALFNKAVQEVQGDPDYAGATADVITIAATERWKFLKQSARLDKKEPPASPSKTTPSPKTATRPAGSTPGANGRVIPATTGVRPSPQPVESPVDMAAVLGGGRYQIG